MPLGRVDSQSRAEFLARDCQQIIDSGGDYIITVKDKDP
jgi:hypothetical protein